ncbi:MAG: hypothetical protein H8K08_13595 [Nitrospira sp.]|nr:hypothetical protein [Nitrospira sp.]
MKSGWLKQEIKDVEEEVKNWPDWKKSAVVDKSESQQAQQSSSTRTTTTNLSVK